MPTVRQLGRLFHSIASGDKEAAITSARLIVEEEERRGHRRAARDLRGSLNPNGHATSLLGSGLNVGVASPLGLLIHEPEGPSLRDVMLRPAARILLETLVQEWRHDADLRREGIRRRSSLLFWGPPGCGKTLTARALGRELGVPVVTARLSSVVGAYLGQTGANLRQVFSHAQTAQCVLLLDEFDALGRSRGRGEDVGELDRVVISLLQELDHTNPAGLIIAATNLEKALDRALWRRFDASLSFPLPGKREIDVFLKLRLQRLGIEPPARLLKALSSKRTYAEIDKQIEDHRRQEVLRRARTRRK